MSKYEINHTNIPNDLEYDQSIKLWRYMNFTSLFDILMNNELPLININRFADKSEGSILKQILHDLSYATEFNVSYAMQHYYRTTYVSSWHHAEDENTSMWERYTYGTEGVAIKTNAKRLYDCIKKPGHYHCIIGPESKNFGHLGCVPQTFIKEVKYTNYFPRDFKMDEEYLDLGYDRMFFFYKMKEFKDEAEVRILRSYSHGIHKGMLSADRMLAKRVYEREKKLKDMNINEHVMPLSIGSARELIERIVISPKAHESTIENIKKLSENWIDPDIIFESREKEWLK